MLRTGITHFIKTGLQQAGKHQTYVGTLQFQSKHVTINPIRTTSFFNKLNAEAMWKSVTSVSNAGKKRGRGKTMSRKALFNLHRSQPFGVGKANIRWPGLNSPVLQGHELVPLEKLPPDPEFDEKKVASGPIALKRPLTKVHPLLRGWSGRSLKGKSLGPPPSVEGEKFEDFDTILLHIRYLNLAITRVGKVKSQAAIVIVGNKNGMLGIASAKASDLKTAIKRAQKKAFQRLVHYKLEEKRTINHDFFYQYGLTKVFAYRKPEGYGLVCQRAIAACCNLIGIKDIAVKIEKSRNKVNVVKAFLLGLLEQKTYQQLADENKLHVVEQREECYNFPRVIASPSEVATTKSPSLLFSTYVMGNRLPWTRPKKELIDIYPNYDRHLKRSHYMRNHEEVRLKLTAEYGCVQSHLRDVYPECVGPNYQKKLQTETA